MKVDVKLNLRNIKAIESVMQKSLVETADAIKTDLQQSQTMPFDTGALQNRSTFVDDKKAYRGEVYVVDDTPYARRLYFHPEYNFQRIENPYAGALWFEPYISGSKKEFVKDAYTRILKRNIKQLGG